MTASNGTTSLNDRKATNSAPSADLGARALGDKQFALTAQGADYRFHVDADGELVHDYFGAPAPGLAPWESRGANGWGHKQVDERREFPDHGRGDFRLPAIHVRHGTGSTVSFFEYVGHHIIPGKPKLPGLPATFGTPEDVTTLVVHLEDKRSGIKADLSYSVFPKYNAITRSFTLTNGGTSTIEIQRAASFSIDFGSGDWDMVSLSGEWCREAKETRRKVQIGTQGFQSSTGHSSHYFNPFVALLPSTTTETHGPAYGLSLVYSGSFNVDVERHAFNLVRASIGLNPLHLSWPLAPGESFTTPEAVAVYSSEGLGGMSRNLHSLYRNHLSRSSWTQRERPVLLNSWEGMYFDFTAEMLYTRAKDAAELGVSLFVLDDGWFGDKHPRVHDNAGLGDWVVNPRRFPAGLDAFVKTVNELKVEGGRGPLKFGIWVEPEMVNPSSELYEAHPDWVLHSGTHKRTEMRQQLILDLSKREVQDYIIEAIGKILWSAHIEYVKWDCNRGMHELPSPTTPHAYMLGLYRVLESLTTSFPQILFEGCASGGGRFDPGILYYWPQSWTSDDTDPIERLHIQFGTSLVYPPSSMGCHVSAAPGEQVGRTTPLLFRAHVALMGGSFGFELETEKMSAEERAQVTEIVALAERVNPYVIHGDLYRLALPDESNWPAALYVKPDGSSAVLLAYQIYARIRIDTPLLRLQGLDHAAVYEIDGVHYTGAVLMHVGLKLDWKPEHLPAADHQSKVLFINRV
ncbi:hypothetical protein VHUM_02041 [Vanrija humicola]|uniref:Alpha-galactosidase n=1 Tax=Vanrija humicola TaxID=5417 RepID=A0A7D8YZC6_VANHU|nr:hypothetical protein VHUM_02041 [Vanrija humicola]